MIKYKFTIILSCIFIQLYLVTAYGELRPNPKLIKGKLDNGLTYYIYPNDYPKGEAVYRLFIKSGSVFEEENQRGLAHFLEHMAFNGTRHFPGESMVKFLESKGAKFGKDLNAHTSFNETVYKLQLPSSDIHMVDSTLMILADWADGLLLDSLEIEKERGVILSEWLSKTGPEYDVQNAFLLELLNGSQYVHRLTIGDTAIIRHFPHERLHNYYETWYHPTLMAVAISGDIDADTVEKIIHERFGKMNAPIKPKVKDYRIPDYSEEKIIKVIHPSLKKIEFNFIQLCPKPSAVKKEKDFLAFLQRALLNRLIKVRLNALAFENPSYKDASAALSSFINTKGVLMASVELVSGKIEVGIQEFATQLEQMYRYGFTSSEIEKVKKVFLRDALRRAESKSPVASLSYMDEIYSDFYQGNIILTPAEEYRIIQKYIGRVDSVSLVKLMKDVRKPHRTHYFLSAFDKASSELPTEEELLSMLARIRSNDITRYEKIIDVPDALISELPVSGTIEVDDTIPEIGARSIILSNGARVIFKRTTVDKDRIMLTGFRKGGLYALDSVDYVTGLFAGSIVPVSGAGDFSRDALSQYLAGNSASLRFLIDKTRTGVAGSAEKRDIQTLFELLYLKWTQPRLDKSVYEQVKDKSIESYLTGNKTDTDKYYRDLSDLMQGHSYVRREITDTLINSELKEERVLPVFNQCFGSAKGYTFIITGNCTFSEIKSFVLRYIGGLPEGISTMDYVYKGGSIPQKNIEFTRKVGDSPKALVSLIFQQDTLSEQLRSFNLKSDIVKAIIRTKLLAELREKMGMVYSVSVSIGATQYPALLSRETIGFSCEPENGSALIAATISQLQKLAFDSLAFETEWANVKQNLIKENDIQMQKNSFWSGCIRNTVYNGDPDWDYITRYEDIIHSVTAKEIMGYIRRCFLESPVIKAVLYPKEKMMGSER